MPSSHPISHPTTQPTSLPAPAHDATPYDALLLVSFGGPERPEDVVPFLRNVTRGRDVPEERLVEVGEHYLAVGGRSPINDQNRALLAAIREDLSANGVDLPVYWGNRNWGPYLVDALREMKAAGVQRALCLVTSAYSSYSGCRQYREDLAEAVAALGGESPEGLRLDRTRAYFNHPGFVEPMVDATLAGLADLPDDVRRDAHLVFVTHSIPVSMNEASGPAGRAYVTQHRSVVAEIVERVRHETGTRHPSDLVFCSRSGPPQVEWLEPDVNDHLELLAKRHASAAVIVPIGFVSDHMEVSYDLDTEAMETAGRLGLPCVRAATAGVDPRFVAMVRDLLLERAEAERGLDPERACVGGLAPTLDVCAAGCCVNPRSSRPALGGADWTPTTSAVTGP